MVTKGYGFTVDDIDWSCPADLDPYAKAHKMEIEREDTLMHMWFGNYIVSAVSVAVEHCLAGKKAKSSYIKEPVLKNIFESESLTEEEILNKEIQKAIMTENMWIQKAKENGLPETVI